MSLRCDLSRLSLDMEGDKGKINQRYCSKLVELSAVDDVTGFISEVEEKGCDVDESSFWYGRRFGSKKMGFGEITPLLIAAMYGNLKVLKYLLGTGKVDVNRAYGVDGVTALHYAAAGGSSSVIEVFKLLIDAGGDINSVDANGNKPLDLAVPNVKSVSNSRRKALEMLLNGVNGVEEQEISKVQSGAEKKEYPIDVSLPDINTGLYGSDDFRMYSFKVMPCSRAYSHDWTECPFVHPGENARRRDPRKYHYSCVPCPEFKKGTCVKGDNCEYAHGVFESWLHPAQYRTRLCKDETGCTRKVCFFAHKPEDLRPLYVTTGSAMPSPKSLSASSMDMSCLSPSTLGSSSLFMSTNSTAPMSPSSACSSPMATNMWQNKVNLTPPALQLHGSRLKSTRSARDLDLEMELLGLESIRTRQQLRQQLIEEMAGLSSPMGTTDYDRMGYMNMNPTNLDDVYGSIDPSLMSPNAFQMRQNTNSIRASYPSNVSSSPGRKTSGFGFETSAAVAAAVMNSRSSAFTKRSQSFNYHANAAASSPKSMSSTIPDWGSPTGKLDWGFKSEDPNKFRKSASFALRNANVPVDEPDVSWVNSLVKDVPSSGIGSEQKHGGGGGGGGGIHEMTPSWIDQLYIDQEQMVA